MAKKKDANHALQAALDSWNWRPPPNPHDVPLVGSPASRGLRTESSVTVFSSDIEEWVHYLSLGVEDRVESEVCVHVHLQPETVLLSFAPENVESRWLSDLLAEGFLLLYRHLEKKPYVMCTLRELLFEPSNARLPVR